MAYQGPTHREHTHLEVCLKWENCSIQPSRILDLNLSKFRYLGVPVTYTGGIIVGRETPGTYPGGAIPGETYPGTYPGGVVPGVTGVPGSGQQPGGGIYTGEAIVNLY